MSESDLILIVEDENDLVDTLEYRLEREGFETHSTDKGKEALEFVDGDRLPDLILLDLMLPDISGTEVCRRIRENEEIADLPIVMLTARDEEIDRVVGFEAGADDYVVKPFSMRELVLRIRAILRRLRQQEEEESRAEEDESETPEEITFGEIRIDVPGHRVWVDEDEVSLTALEFKLLTTFLERKGRAQTRDVLLSDVWGINADIKTRTVDTHVKRLREKLGPAGSYIETVRGVGYRFRSQPDG
jgi:two-component system phosphate regulon response regulator PhoB